MPAMSGGERGVGVGGAGTGGRVGAVGRWCRNAEAGVPSRPGNRRNPPACGPAQAGLPARWDQVRSGAVPCSAGVSRSAVCGARQQEYQPRPNTSHAAKRPRVRKNRGIRWQWCYRAGTEDSLCWRPGGGRRCGGVRRVPNPCRHEVVKVPVAPHNRQWHKGLKRRKV